MTDLGQVLADLRGEAAVLRRQGHNRQAATIEDVCDKVQDAAPDYLTWLSEDDAMLRSGRSRAYLRVRFPEYEANGMARRDGRRRRYRACIIPRRANLDAARAAGREAARQAVA